MSLSKRCRHRICRSLAYIVLLLAAMLSVVPILASRGTWYSSVPSPILATHVAGKAATKSNRSSSSSSPSNRSVSALRGGGLEGEGSSTQSSDAGRTATASYRTVQVHLVHRHGDRTPITPLHNEQYWASTLVPPDLLGKISQGTYVVRPEGVTVKAHAATGRGPFGKLTQMGLLQMIEVGSRLKDELEGPDTVWAPSARLISGTNKETKSNEGRVQLHPQDVKVYSTDFERTIQSVQGVLVGFFPDGPSPAIEIDCRHTTSWMIPDPQPRRTHEQEQLEIELAHRPHILEREAEMRPLAVRCSQALAPLLGQGAFDVSFGVGEEGGDAGDTQQQRVLPWAQLAEVTKCLQVRGLLPDSISDDDQEALSGHTAWRWFESLRNPRLAYLSMHLFTRTIVQSMQNHNEEPPIIIYSCHDSSLIGLLCAFHLEQPSVWPEYGSVLKIELLERQLQHKATEEHPGDEKDYVVRFSLNGEALRSQWHGDLREEILLDKLAHFVTTEGAAYVE